MNYDGKVIISTALDNSGLEKGVNNISGSFGGLKSVLGKLTGMIATAFSVTAVVQFGVESSKAAMSLENALLGLQSIVEGQGRSFLKAKTFIEEYTKDGLIPATNAITAYKNLASRGYDDSQIKQVMISLKDASAFGRQASMSMGEAVQSATEGLKNENSILVDNAGVTKNVAKMWDEYARSIGTTANNLTQQQKIQAEVAGILEESKYQAGDAAKVANTLSGKLSQLSYNFNNLKIAVGGVVNPIVNYFLPAVNSAIAAITEFINGIAEIVGSVFGVATMGGAAGDSISDNFWNAADSANDLVTSTNKAVKAAKALAGFDELNVLKSKQNTSSGSTKPGGISTGIVSATQAVKEITSKVTNAIDPKKLGEAIGKIIKKVNWKETFKTIGKAIGDTIKGAFELTSEIVKEIDWSEVGKAFSEGLAGAFLEMDLPGIILALTKFAASLAIPLVEFITGFFGGDVEPGQEQESFIARWWQAFIEGLTDSITNENGESVWDAIKGPLETATKNDNEFWNRFGKAFLNKLTGGLVTEFEKTKMGFQKLGEMFFDTFLDGIEERVSKIYSWLQENVFKPITDAWNYLFCGSGNEKDSEFYGYGESVFSSFANGIKSAFPELDTFLQNIKKPLEERFDDILKSIKDLFPNLSKYLEDNKDGIESPFEDMANTISEGFKSALNDVIDLMNKFISWVNNRLNFNIPSFEIAGQKLWNSQAVKLATIPKIPHLAQGAVLPANKPFMAVVGDQRHGTNVEAPLATIQEAMANVLADFQAGNMAGHEAVVQRLERLISAVEQIEVGDAVIGQAAQRYNRKQAVIHGGSY